MDILIKTLQVILALSILVLVHELGHFFFARIFHIRVDKFYLFFNPQISLIRCKKINGRWRFRFLSRNVPDKYRLVTNSFGEVVKDEKGKPVMEEIPLAELPSDDWRRELDCTEYGIGWLPLGGYCKVSGMIDESMDTKNLAKEPQPWEFRSKPAWQRFFVMFGGVLFNLIFAFLLHSAILFTWGEAYLKNGDALYGVVCSDLAKEVGFRDGDKILAFDQKSLSERDFKYLIVDLLHLRPEMITVLRGADTVQFGFDQKWIPRLLKSRGLFDLNTPFVVQAVTEDSHNQAAGILSKDRLTAINDIPIHSFADARHILQQHAGDSIVACFDRGGVSVVIPLWINHEGLIGVIRDFNEGDYFHITQKNYSFFAAIPAGVHKASQTVRAYIQDLGLIFSPKTEAYKSVGSVIAIGQIFPPFWDWMVFWNITALLSIMFAVLNLLPIPALDGGHIFFVLYEMITRRKPGDKFLEYAQMTGMVILLTIITLAMGNDIIRLFK